MVQWRGLAVADKTLYWWSVHLGLFLKFCREAGAESSEIPEARMLWMHEFLNNPRAINPALDGGSGASFGYDKSEPYRNSVFAGAGVTAQIGQDWSAERERS